jgi:hypothetical protein
MRTVPTALDTSGTASDYSIAHSTTFTTCSVVPVIGATGTTENMLLTLTVASGLTTGQASQLRAVNTSAYLGFSAEL